MKKYLSQMTFAALTLTFLGGCVTAPEMVLPQDEMTPFPSASDRTPVRTEKSFTIQASTDERPSYGPHQFGWSGMNDDDRKPVVAEQTVAETVSDRLRSELNTRGFRSGLPGDVNLALTIHRFDIKSVKNGAFAGPECDAEVTIDISKPGSKEVTKFKVNSQFTAPAPLFKTQLANSQTIASCVNLIAERLAKSDELKTILAR